MLDINTIHQGDCLDLMNDIDDKSIDMILCDLPYGTTQCRWDSVIPLEPLWAHYRRIIKSNGAIVLTAQQPFSTVLAASNIKMLRYEWIWEKNIATGHLNAKRAPMKAHEQVLVFCAGQPTYNPQMTRGVPYKPQGGPSRPDGVYGSFGAGKRAGSPEGLRYPRSVLQFASERGLHPTQKPQALMEYLIQTYTNPGELVLDNCFGSGTTLVAAQNMGRNWIGIERDEEYCDIARKRLAA